MEKKGKLIAYWKKSSRLDFQAAQELCQANKFPHALFFAHLSVEKILKALFIDFRDEHPPITHNLIFLIDQVGIKAPEYIKEELIEINTFNIEARYPDIKFTFHKKCDSLYTQHHMQMAEKVIKWLTRQLSKS